MVENINSNSAGNSAYVFIMILLNNEDTLNTDIDTNMTSTDTFNTYNINPDKTKNKRYK